MPDPVGLFAILLLPVAVILFMTRNFGRKIRHPHDLLLAGEGPRIARFFFRSLRSRYDLLFDAAIALVLAFALHDIGRTLTAPPQEGPPSSSRAVVMDCSRSMFAGAPGSRPIDAALDAISTRPSLAGAKLFALVFDIDSRTSRVQPWSALGIAGIPGRTISSSDVAARLLASSPLYSVDYGALSSLAAKGYGDITLITDLFPYEARGFKVLETGFAGRPLGLDGSGDAANQPLRTAREVDALAPEAWPASLRYDRTREKWLASFVETGRRTRFSLEAPDARTGAFSPIPSSSYAIEERGEGRRVAFSHTGPVRFVFADPEGGIPLVFDAVLPPTEIAAFAAGSFSELVRRALPYLALRPRPSLALVDRGREEEAKRAGASRIVTTALVGRASLLADPGLLGGRPLAEALVPGTDEAWGPESIANPDLPLAYDALVRSFQPPTFVENFPRRGPIVSSGGGAWLVSEGSSPLAVNPPPSEFFAPARGGLLELHEGAHKSIWAILLALLAAGKFVVWKLLSPEANKTAGGAARRT